MEHSLRTATRERGRNRSSTSEPKERQRSAVSVRKPRSAFGQERPFRFAPMLAIHRARRPSESRRSSRSWQPGRCSSRGDEGTGAATYAQGGHTRTWAAVGRSWAKPFAAMSLNIREHGLRSAAPAARSCAAPDTGTATSVGRRTSHTVRKRSGSLARKIALAQPEDES